MDTAKQLSGSIQDRHLLESRQSNLAEALSLTKQTYLALMREITACCGADEHRIEPDLPVEPRTAAGSHADHPKPPPCSSALFQRATSPRPPWAHVLAWPGLTVIPSTAGDGLGICKDESSVPPVTAGGRGNAMETSLEHHMEATLDFTVSCSESIWHMWVPRHCLQGSTPGSTGHKANFLPPLLHYES
ncbi:uncharacterized protein ACIBXB_012997 isoform 1-T1 [Morphnus guianensis]